ncbi:MAG: PHP domain-containing protein [Clostridia bacterium]|nr:PHP domain-containing protein [Clostridia bacterium]
MKIYYDLHIHSALSPCGDEDMTPNNIVNMACLKGLGLIGVTDHNSAKNVRAVMEAAQGKIKVIPGIEVTTREEVHTLCYFPSVDAAEDMGELLRKHMQNIKNRPEIFGRQLVMNSEDRIIGEEENLLINAINLDIYEVQKETKKRGGFFVPAHVDRQSYSVTSNLGFLPPDLEVDALEITESGLLEYSLKYKEYEIITSSDAHYLENISEPQNFLKGDGKITKKILENLYKI